MFRRKEEGLFDTDVLEDQEATESATVVTPAAVQTTAPISTPINQPITRPSAAVPPAISSVSAANSTSNFRTSSSYNAPASATPARTEAKPLSAFSVTPAGAKPSGNRVLTVGHDILLKGEINSCDRLVIEGKLEATLSDVHTLELAQIGSFKGSAQVSEAEISGSFEGDLIVTGRLVIYASGSVSGKISYGEIEIERGGQLSGEIKTLGTASAKNTRKEAA